MLLSLTNVCKSSSLESISDEELNRLATSEKHVIVLFSKDDCTACNNLEEQLASIREDLVDSLGAWVVKGVSSNLASKYSPNKEPEPAIVFFRSGVPLLYEGPVNDEVMMDIFVQNQEPTVHSLTDESFEHLTQAATGATTGDWFIMFYRTDCEFCHRFASRWEYVGSQLKGRTNLAKVDIQDAGISTGRRFNVEKIPTFLFFRQGKYYHYDISNVDSKSFIEFAKTWYKNASSKTVPVPPSPFDELVDRIVFQLRENPLVVPVLGLVLLAVLFTTLAIFWRSKKSEPKKSTDKKKKK
nr:EOG090X0856 [Eulimnadia texana]